MLEQTLAIIRNTFFESIRQPIVLVLTIAATLLLVVANLTSTFTMSDDQKMLLDVGLATIFLFGALFAAFIATNVLTREIDNRTVLTVVSKPVPRPLFIIGKYFGVAGAMVIASIYMACVFTLVEHHGVLQRALSPYHYPVIVFGLSAAFISIVVALWCNYFYGKVFGSTLLCVATPLAGLAYFLALLFEHDFSKADLSRAFDANLWKAIAALIVANMVLTAIAIAISTRLNQIMTVIITIGAFLFGLLSDWLFAGLITRPIEARWLARAELAGKVEIVSVPTTIHYTRGESMTTTVDVKQATEPLSSFADGYEYSAWLLGDIAHSITPNFQVLWLSDAITQEHVIPGSYVVRVAIYGALLVAAFLALAIVLFQRREVG
jgi:ABC-type transport system involved in multi-copper enzyme maturation permease subunit